MPYKLLYEVNVITNKERQDGRFLRDRAKRKERIQLRNKTIEEVFTLRNMYTGYLSCIKGVRWKPSTQCYRANGLKDARDGQRSVLNEVWKSNGFIERDICDRGKNRHIKSVHISERVIQHTLCDNLITPALTPILIYDNCGSLKNKGMDFALNRLTKLLSSQIRKYGRELYVLTYDFSGYFEHIDHDVAIKFIKRYITDEKCFNLSKQLIKEFGESGLGLGSQISQNVATAFPNSIDHAFKEELGIKAYVRYMDDGIAIHHSKEHLEHCVTRLRELCADLGITVNEKKTHIRKLSCGFVFLKMRFNITETGKIIKRVSRKTITRGRRKIKRLFKLLSLGKITRADIDTTLASMLGHLKRGYNYNSRKNLIKLTEANSCI